MAISVLQALIIPKVLGVEEFSYWQLYLFYIGYVGMCHLGLSSGVYLEMGGQTRHEIDKSSVKAQFLFGALYETAMAVVVIVITCLASASIGEKRQFVICATAVSMVFLNAATFMMNVLQCMNETRTSSCSTIVLRLAFAVPLVTMIFLAVDAFEPYVFAYALSAVVQVAYCAWYLRDFAGAAWPGFGPATRMGCHSISVGVSLMLANVASILILGVARFFIDTRWGIEAFGRLSLVLSMVNFFLAFVNQAGMVLFPALRQGEEGEVRRLYEGARDALALCFPAAYLLYFPMVWVLRMWLPNYADALSYLALLMPICVFDSKMSITGATYFNVLRKERVMLKLNVGCAVLSAVLACIGTYVVESVEAVIVGVVAVIVFRSIVAERYLSRELCVGASLISIWEVVLTVVFVFAATRLDPTYAIAAYTITYGLYVWAYRGRFMQVARALRAS